MMPPRMLIPTRLLSYAVMTARIYTLSTVLEVVVESIVPSFAWAAPATSDTPDTTRLSDVVVTGTRSEKFRADAPVQTEVVDRKEIATTGALTLKDALENVPGLKLQELHGKSGYGLSLQGLSSDQVLVLIDGLPISASTGSSVDLSQYLLTDVLRVEVVKGAASAQYGSAAMGGVVNVITRHPREGLQGNIQVGVGTRGRQNASGKRVDAALKDMQADIQGGIEHVRGRLALSRLSDSGFSIAPAGWVRQGDRIRREQVGGSLVWTPAPRTDLSMDIGRYEERDLQRYQSFVPPRYVPQHKTEKVGRNRLVLNARHHLEQGSLFDIRLLDEHYQAHSQNHANGVRIIDRVSQQHINHLSLQWDTPLGSRQSWQWGADLHRETLEQQQNGVSELQGSGIARRSSHEFYTQGDLFLTPVWELVPGVRWQSDSDFGQHWAPKLAVRGRVYEVGDQSITLRFGIGQGYRVPNLKERHYLFDHSALGYKVIGNPDLRPESSTSVQLGGVLALGNLLTVDLNAYLNRVRDLIQTDINHARNENGISVYSYDNVARARTHGLEASVTWVPAARWRLNTALTVGHTRDLSTHQEIAGQPRRIATLGMDWDASDRTHLAMRLRHQSSELSDVGSNLRSDGWTVVDLSVQQRLTAGLSAFLNVDNTFNKQRNFGQAYQKGPIEGRVIMTGLRYAFDGKTVN